MPPIVLKNIVAEPWKHIYGDLRLATKATETCGMAAGRNYIAAPWETGGGGMIGIIPLSECKRNPRVLKLKGHTGSIHDTGFATFSPDVVASASEDTTVKIWKIPPDFQEKAEIKGSHSTLEGHSKKVMLLQWNVATNNILATGSFDATIKLWDANQESCVTTLRLDETPYSLAWDSKGEMLVTATRDRMLRLIDIRNCKKIAEAVTHDGSKAVKALYIEGLAGIAGHILSTGFSKSFTRELKLWDSRNLSSPVSVMELDKASQPLYPTYDDCLGLIYVAAKGDGIARVLQLQGSQLIKTGEYRSNVPVKTFCFTPKLCCDATRCEIGRMLRCENGKDILPVSFSVPRRSEAFQKDLYPDVLPLEEQVDHVSWLAQKEYSIRRCSYSHNAMIQIPKNIAPSAARPRHTSLPTTLSEETSSHRTSDEEQSTRTAPEPSAEALSKRNMSGPSSKLKNAKDTKKSVADLEKQMKVLEGKLNEFEIFTTSEDGLSSPERTKKLQELTTYLCDVSRGVFKS